MLFSRQPGLGLPLATYGTPVAIVTTLLVWQLKGLNGLAAVALFMTLEGTILLAGSITFGIPPIGQGWKARLRWTLIEFPKKYASPASFNPLEFYLGLFFLFLGAVIGAIAR